MNAVAGRRPDTVKLEPFRFEQMRPGCYDIDARVRDMDIGGIWASVNFPSQITGFCGRVFFNAKDRELGAGVHRGLERLDVRGVVPAVPRAHHPVGITYLADPERAVRRDPPQGRLWASRR